MLNYTIEHDNDKTIIAAVEDGSLPPMVVLGESGRVFHRRTQSVTADGESAGGTSWLVGEISGVRCYFDGASIVLTKEDLYP